jgi:EF hand
MSGMVTRRPACAALGACGLGLALLTGGCAGDSSLSMTPDEMFDSYDTDGDGSLSPAEFDQFHIDLDADGDGAVSRDEFNAGMGGGDGDR